MHDAHPVRLDVAEPAAARLRAWLEGTLGWQVVDDDTTSIVPAVCGLVDVASAASAPRSGPTVLLVGGDDDPVATARAVSRLSPLAVVHWPDERDRLPAIVERGASTVIDPGAMADELRVAGATGGVGTTTVALSLGGLVAWGGRHVLAVCGGAVPVAPLRTLSAEDLAGAGTWEAATVASGCDRLRVVRCAGSFESAVVDAGRATLLVRDLGLAEDPDVLVLRRDRPGVEALDGTAAGVAVVLDDGVIPLRTVRAAAGRRRLIVLERSQRVARATARHRVPGGLPGTWLRSLGAALAAGRPQPASVGATWSGR